MLGYEDGEGVFSDMPYDISLSPIKDAHGWADAPADAKEFTILLSGGLNRRLGLILKNADGVYDKVAIYKSKKVDTPIMTLDKGVLSEFVDESIKNDTRYKSNRFVRLLELEEDGSRVKMWFGPALDVENDTLWHPTSLYKKVIDNVGYVKDSVIMGGSDRWALKDCMIDSWSAALDWTADALHYLIENEGYEVLFTQVHNIDAQGHILVKHMKEGKRQTSAEEYQEFFKETYIQTDEYIGRFLHLLDEGWSIAIVSDHAQVCPEEGALLFGDMSGVNVTLMRELGLTAVKEDENGNPLKEIDWERTTAIAQRGNHIYLNLKGRDPHGIIDPADQFEVEEEIMTRLYGYKHPKTGKRVFSLALRNRDAVLLGMGGPECGDILVWTAEGYNYDHCDSLSTTYGYAGTSVSPIVLFAGEGFKEGVYTDRVIRQVDFAPTLAAIGGVRMPAAV